ncbi:hypothetical protein ACA910_002458 [Epithemia clementina (nom. ined.)]
MIIDASAIILTLVAVTVGLYGGLQLIRRFALEIAQENHDALAILDQRAEDERIRKERAADAAASSAFAKVQPILTSNKLASSAAASNTKSPRSTTGELRTPASNATAGATQADV